MIIWNIALFRTANFKKNECEVFYNASHSFYFKSDFISD